MTDPSPIADASFPTDVGIAFRLLAFYGLLASAPLMVVGLFSGPHILTGALVHLAVGVAALTVAKGWSRRAGWARSLAVLLATLLAVVAAGATISLSIDGAYAAAFVPSALCLLSLAIVWRVSSAGTVAKLPAAAGASERFGEYD